MVRVLRYPRLCAGSCLLALLSALGRDLCVGAGLTGLARMLLLVTGLLLALSFLLLSCRFFVDAQGVGVGFLLRVRRTEWKELHALGALCCNSRRMYLYGLYRRNPDFLQMLHRAPLCGEWGFIVPLSKRLTAAVQTYCPYSVDLTPTPKKKPDGRLRPLWHQAALYLALMVPAAMIAFLTAGLMLLRASGRESILFAFGLTAAAFALCLAGILLLNRASVSLMTCPRINEKGLSAGVGLYLPWEDIRFAFVRQMPQGSGFFLLSQELQTVSKRGAPPVCCLSLPDTSTLLLAYLTYCPHADQGMGG